MLSSASWQWTSGLDQDETVASESRWQPKALALHIGKDQPVCKAPLKFRQKGILQMKTWISSESLESSGTQDKEVVAPVPIISMTGNNHQQLIS